MSDSSDLIAVVDDDASVRRAVANLFESLGFRVEAFASAESFLESDVRAAACLVLDIRLPAMSGLDLLEHLARMGLALGVVMLTAHGDEVTRRRAATFGAGAFLPKPFQSEELVQAVRSLATEGTP